MRNPKGETLIITLEEVFSDTAHELGVDPGPAEGRRRGPPPGAAGRQPAHDRRGPAARAPRVPHRHRPGRPAVPRRATAARSPSRSSAGATSTASSSSPATSSASTSTRCCARCAGIFVAQRSSPRPGCWPSPATSRGSRSTTTSCAASSPTSCGSSDRGASVDRPRPLGGAPATTTADDRDDRRPRPTAATPTGRRPPAAPAAGAPPRARHPQPQQRGPDGAEDDIAQLHLPVPLPGGVRRHRAPSRRRCRSPSSGADPATGTIWASSPMTPHEVGREGHDLAVAGPARLHRHLGDLRARSSASFDPFGINQRNITKFFAALDALPRHLPGPPAHPPTPPPAG